jgi:hypothetical protein
VIRFNTLGYTTGRLEANDGACCPGETDETVTAAIWTEAGGVEAEPKEGLHWVKDGL